jgi:hypothetical protein
MSVTENVFQPRSQSRIPFNVREIVRIRASLLAALPENMLSDLQIYHQKPSAGFLRPRSRAC